jgi:hypothetical protein
MSELIQTLKDAQHEINGLRRRNELLSAKVEVMDSFMCVLHTRPAEHNQAMGGIDVVFQMEKHIAKLEDAAKPQAAPPVDNAFVAPGCERFGVSA